MTVASGALLPLPAIDELILTHAELAKLTGANQSRLQIGWLQANCWVFFRTRSGRPVVGRLYANLRLANVDLGGMLEPRAFSLNMAAINGCA